MTRRRGDGRAAAGVGACVVLASTLAGCASPEPAARPGHDPAVYPYLEVSSDGPQDLVRITRDAGVDGLTLAFVIDGQGCRPVWSRGGQAATHALVKSRVAAARSAGMPVRISFGGAGGTDLASACDSADTLAAAYRAVVDAYRPDSIDLDVEGRALADRAGNARRVAAVRSVQRAAAADGRPLPVSFTLPAGPDGITTDGVRLLTDSIAAGLTISAVNVMVMNYGWGVADLGDEAVRQAGLAHELIRRLWPELSKRESWRRVALTAMVGRNDVPGETFHADDARALVRFATKRGVGWLSYWSLERDRGCPRPPPTQPSWRCSGVSQRPYQFARIFTASGA